MSETTPSVAAEKNDPYEVDSVYFVLAYDAIAAATPDISPDSIPAGLKRIVHCYLVLKSGRVVVAETSNVSEGPFDMDQAKKAAESNARLLLERIKLLESFFPMNARVKEENDKSLKGLGSFEI